MNQAQYTTTKETAKGTRIWMEGQKLAQAGWTAGEPFAVEYDRIGQVIRLNLDPAGSRKVSGKEGRPIIDLQSQQVSEIFAGGERVQFLLNGASIVISLHHESRAQAQREAQFIQRRESGQLVEASMFTGGGVSTEAIHEAITEEGMSARVAWVAEFEQKYIEAAGQNCLAIDNETKFLIGDVSEIEPEHYTNCDLLSFSMPCAGHSVAGKAKHKMSAIDHSGLTLFPVVSAIKSANPAVVVSENVKQAKSSAIYQLLRLELERLGYVVFEFVLDSSHTDSIENRERYWLVAFSAGLAPESFDFESVVASGAGLDSILEPVDESEWKDHAYLKNKAASDKAAGKGFARQLLSGSETRIGTIGRGYAKRRSTEPMLAREDGLERLLTPAEHCRAKGAPERLAGNMSKTIAHEVLGQSVDYRQPKIITKKLFNCLTNNGV